VFAEEPLDAEIGGRIRHIRKLRGLSQTELGVVLGVTFQQIQKYERGTNRISASALVLLARALDIAPSALLGAQTETLPKLDWRLLSETGAHEFMEAMSRIRSAQGRRVVLDLARGLTEHARALD
jgi:transcriptional regulator with XRE-family HTH domain